MIHVALFGVALFFVVDFGVARDDDIFVVGVGCNSHDSGDCGSSSGVDNCCNGCGVGGASEGCCVSTCRSADGGGVTTVPCEDATTGSGDFRNREVVLEMRAFFLRAGG